MAYENALQIIDQACQRGMPSTYPSGETAPGVGAIKINTRVPLNYYKVLHLMSRIEHEIQCLSNLYLATQEKRHMKAEQAAQRVWLVCDQWLEQNLVDHFIAYRPNSLAGENEIAILGVYNGYLYVSRTTAKLPLSGADIYSVHT
ncbi:MAG: hypothetical protein LR017_00660 [Candidatus Pacebacteria bacterium]|nr:hypothetical protein [Candidatus Paceibacterota bacterium]